MTDTLIRCPICAGRGSADCEARRMRVGMCQWVEKACRCCTGHGYTTATRLAQYRINRLHDDDDHQLTIERRKRWETA